MEARAWWSVLALLTIVMLALPMVPPGRTTSSLPQAGVIIPLYTAPSSEWNAVVQAKLANPSLPFIVIVNPGNGPGAISDPGFAGAISNLKANGIMVFGYIYTNYGQASISSVEAAVSDYKSWYNVDGIFFDGMPNVLGYEGYYSTLNSYSKSLGLHTIGNPGTPLPVTYTGIFDLYVLDESTTPPTSSGPYPASSSASIIFGVPTVNQAYVTALSKLSGFIYITDQSLPNPYNALPSYFGSLVSMIATANGGSSGSTVTTWTSPPPPPGPQVVIKTTLLNGTGLTGYWTVITSGGWVVASGYSTLTFVATPGDTYSVSIVNYNGHVLDHWSTGQVTNTITTQVTGNTTLTAYYRLGQTVVMNIRSQSTGGVPIVGLWTTISMDDVAVDSGYTPLRWEAAAGQAYTVQTDNYGNYQFINWLAGSNSDPLTIMPSGPLNLTAVYLTYNPGPSTSGVTTSQPYVSVTSQSASGSTTTVTVPSPSGGMSSESGSPSPVPPAAYPIPAMGNAAQPGQFAPFPWSYLRFAIVVGTPSLVLAAAFFLRPLNDALTKRIPLFRRMSYRRPKDK